MTLLQIDREPPPDRHVPLFELGFRPFFLGAAIFAMVTIGRWMAAYVFGTPLALDTLSASQWHAHEMIYGYSLAVIAGFLLTAVRNWTRIQTPRGPLLALLFSLWAAARALYFLGTGHLLIAGALDLAFLLGLSVAVIAPIVRTRQWRQIGISAKLVFLLAGHVAFLLGALGRLEMGVYWGLYGGFYLVIALILTMGARVIPNFIRNGVDYEVTLPNPPWMTVASLVLFVAFFVSELFLARPVVTQVAAALLFALMTVRLAGWHTRGIWKRPLLSSLYLSFVFIDAGFLLYAVGPWLGLTKFLAIHALSVGGIGLVTLGMMARVSLGHSGRTLNDVPKALGFAVAAVAAGAVVRVAFPIAAPNLYVTWIAASQTLWIAAFALFTAAYAPILIGPSKP